MTRHAKSGTRILMGNVGAAPLNPHDLWHCQMYSGVIFTKQTKQKLFSRMLFEQLTPKMANNRSTAADEFPQTILGKMQVYVEH